MKIVKEILTIEKMLIELGYNVENITIEEILEIRKAIKTTITK